MCYGGTEENPFVSSYEAQIVLESDFSDSLTMSRYIRGRRWSFDGGRCRHLDLRMPSAVVKADDREEATVTRFVPKC